MSIADESNDVLKNYRNGYLDFIHYLLFLFNSEVDCAN